ncbi:MAG: 50S ribosomal protein L4 [bacterium]|nr:50S ribosomal protein L4 [bacterium]
MSLKIKIYNQDAEAAGEMELSSKVFGVKVNEALVHQAVVTQMANERKVIAHTKTRSEVRGGGKKPWAQKGTGRARHGSSRSPIWKGGGVTFGPRNDRNFKMRINKKMKQGAMLMVLSDKLASDHLVVLDKFSITEFKTKFFNQILANLENKIFTPLNSGSAEVKQAMNLTGQVEAKPKKTKTGKSAKKRSILIIVEKTDEKLTNSAKNLPGVLLINMNNINIVDLLKYKNLIIARTVVEKLEERYK